MCVIYSIEKKKSLPIVFMTLFVYKIFVHGIINEVFWIELINHFNLINKIVFL